MMTTSHPREGCRDVLLSTSTVCLPPRAPPQSPRTVLGQEQALACGGKSPQRGQGSAAAEGARPQCWWNQCLARLRPMRALDREDSVRGRARRLSASVAAFAFSLGWLCTLPRLFKLSLFSSTQLTAEKATPSFKSIVPHSTLLSRACSGRVFDIWLLYLLLITLISVIVLTFIFILLCIRPKTALSHNTTDFVVVFSLLENLGSVMRRWVSIPGLLPRPGSPCLHVRPGPRHPSREHRTGLPLTVGSSALIPFKNRHHGRRSQADLLLYLRNINLV